MNTIMNKKLDVRSKKLETSGRAAAPYSSTSRLVPLNSSPNAFSLIELLVVISIIAILMAILLPALSKIMSEAHGTATREEMSAISSACLSYEATFNAYPGPFSEADISQQLVKDSGGNVITGTQNMLIGLMGTMYNALPTAAQLGSSGYVQVSDLVGADDNGGNGFWVTNPLGSGPIDYGNGGVQKASFFNPKSVDLLPEPPSLATSAPVTAGTAGTWLPTLYDAYPDGLPILYYRRNPGMPGATGVPVWLSAGNAGGAAGTGAAYYLGDNLPYTDSGSGSKGAVANLDAKTGTTYNQYNQVSGTLLVQSSYYSGATGPFSPENALANVLINQSLATGYTGPANANTIGFPVQGDFAMISAGADHIYGYNNYSGGGVLVSAGPPYPTSDDIVVFGGQ